MYSFVKSGNVMCKKCREDASSSCDAPQRKMYHLTMDEENTIFFINKEKWCE